MHATAKRGKQDSEGFIVELVCIDEFAGLFYGDWVPITVNGTSCKRMRDE